MGSSLGKKSYETIKKNDETVIEQFKGYFENKFIELTDNNDKLEKEFKDLIDKIPLKKQIELQSKLHDEEFKFCNTYKITPELFNEIKYPLDMQEIYTIVIKSDTMLKMYKSLDKVTQSNKEHMNKITYRNIYLLLIIDFYSVNVLE